MHTIGRIWLNRYDCACTIGQTRVYNRTRTPNREQTQSTDRERRNITGGYYQIHATEQLTRHACACEALTPHALKNVCVLANLSVIKAVCTVYLLVGLLWGIYITAFFVLTSSSLPLLLLNACCYFPFTECLLGPECPSGFLRSWHPDASDARRGYSEYMWYFKYLVVLTGLELLCGVAKYARTQDTVNEIALIYSHILNRIQLKSREYSHWVRLLCCGIHAKSLEWFKLRENRARECAWIHVNSCDLKLNDEGNDFSRLQWNDTKWNLFHWNQVN